MRRTYLAFLRGVSVNTFSKLGAAFATAAAITFLLFQALSLVGMLGNAYFGLVLYLGFPSLFILGLLLIPVGWWVEMKKTGQPLRTLLSKRFGDEDLEAKATGARLLRTVTLFTAINVLLLGAGTVRMLHFMDSAHFCGTACHSVMNPEWTTYQQSPHARVKCVECHVGEGVDALVKSKINGAWQMVSATFDLYERPIPTPVHQLRPARETCEKCHWPDKFSGNRIRSYVHYESDSTNTARYTTLMMKIGSGREGHATGSHWHVAEENEVRYASVEDEREQMLYVEALQPDGSWKRYTNKKLAWCGELEHEDLRTMDCVDCHNRATHIYEQPEDAVDERMRLGLIPETLPFIKKRALGALLNGYPDEAAAMKGIDAHIRNWYRREYPNRIAPMSKEIDRAVETVQAIWLRNIHPGMNIGWGAYPSHLGHQEGEGCFRCHTPDLVDDAGESIPMDCTLCHSILAEDAIDPMEYLVTEPDDTTANGMQAHYLSREFEQSFRD
ncbi:NapC/NirT family cytochrome c [bacterium]|nr:NapC/NirT family cytochrome c [bacterium]